MNRITTQKYITTTAISVLENVIKTIKHSLTIHHNQFTTSINTTTAKTFNNNRLILLRDAIQEALDRIEETTAKARDKVVLGLIQ
jgi:hypothetical protein